MAARITEVKIEKVAIIHTYTGRWVQGHCAQNKSGANAMVNVCPVE